MMRCDAMCIYLDVYTDFLLLKWKKHTRKNLSFRKKKWCRKRENDLNVKG